jgi:hypothetical protein
MQLKAPPAIVLVLPYNNFTTFPAVDDWLNGYAIRLGQPRRAAMAAVMSSS